MYYSLRVDVDDEKRKDGSKPDIIGLQEIACPNCVVSQKCAPSLAARKFRWSRLSHVSLNRALCDSNSKLQELAANSFRSPGHVFSGHAVNECNDLRVNLGNRALGILRLPTPEEPKSLTVPTKYRVRFHEQQRVPPMGQKARKQDNEATLMGLEDRTFDFSRRDDELLAKQGGI